MVSEERIKTNLLLTDYLDYWDELTVKSINDEWTLRYYNIIMNLLNSQVDEAVKWLDSEEAEQMFKEEAQYQYELFQSLEEEWDKILESKYPSVEALLQEVYNRGKAKGYANMREHIRFSDTDKLSLEFIRDYNFNLIQSIDDDTREQIKNITISSVLAGENPRSAVPKIRDTVGTRLEGSTFTPMQRAVMIARTEISRAQNTGIIQSYVNEGYTEVKILTAEDNNVCYTCLSYAYEFNEESEIIFANHGEEKVHNIQELIKGEMFPPFHPNCRCTYLSVWESKRKVPMNPYVVKLVPRKALSNIKEKINKIRNRKEKYLNNPTDTAEYFGLEYHGVETYDSRNYHKFYDKDFDCSFYIDDELTQGQNALISLTNDENCLHNLKEILKTYKQSPSIMKENTKTISFCNYNHPQMALGLNSYEIDPSQQYYGDNFVEIFKNSIESPINSTENLYMSMLHELTHSADLNMINGLSISTNPRYEGAMIRDGIDRCSVHAEGSEIAEDLAEAGAMASFKNISNKSFAKITVNIPEYDRYGNIITYHTETLDYEEFCVLCKHRVTLLEELLEI